MEEETYLQDGLEAKLIASTIPYYPFHGKYQLLCRRVSLYTDLYTNHIGIDRFYDISGMLSNPEAFHLCIDIFVKRYRTMNVDIVAGLVNMQ